MKIFDILSSSLFNIIILYIIDISFICVLIIDKYKHNDVCIANMNESEENNNTIELQQNYTENFNKYITLENTTYLHKTIYLLHDYNIQHNIKLLHDEIYHFINNNGSFGENVDQDVLYEQMNTLLYMLKYIGGDFELKSQDVKHLCVVLRRYVLNGYPRPNKSNIETINKLLEMTKSRKVYQLL